MIEYSITCDKLAFTLSSDFFGIVVGVLGPIAAIIFFLVYVLYWRTVKIIEITILF